MQISFHSSSTLANAPSDSRVCYLADAKFLSAFTPLNAIKWLFTDLSIDGYKSFSSFVHEKPWLNGIAKINVPLLRALGLNKARCDALEFGFDLGFTSPPPIQSKIPKNYSSIDNYGELIQKKLLGDIQVGTLEVFDVNKALRDNKHLIFHPLGAVPKGSDDCRIIVDTSITGLNDSLLSPPLAFPSIRTILNGTKPLGYGCSFDLSAYFHQLKVRTDQVNFLCITLPDGTTARYRVICFGLRPAPFLAQGTTIDLRDLAIKFEVLEGASTVFVDDFSVTHDDGEILFRVRLSFITFMGMLGFVLHPEKQPLPSQIFKALGYIVNTVDLKLSIAGDKQDKRLNLIKETLKQFSENGFITLNQAQSLVGKLTHSAFIVFTGRFHISPWWKAIAESEKDYRKRHNLDPSAIVPKQTRINRSQPLIDSLLWWQGALSDKKKTSRSLYVKHDGFLDVFDEESFQGVSNPEALSIANSDFMMKHNGITVDVTIDSSCNTFAYSFSSSNGFNGSHSDIFPVDLWLTAQIELELTSTHLALTNILRSFPEGLDANVSKFIIIKSDCPSLISFINDWSYKSEAIKYPLSRIASLAFDYNCQLVGVLVNRSFTSPIHNLAQNSNIRIQIPKNFKFNIAPNFSYDLNRYQALLIHRDSLKLLIQNRSLNKIEKLCFPSVLFKKIETALSQFFVIKEYTINKKTLIKFHRLFKKSSFTFVRIALKS